VTDYIGARTNGAIPAAAKNMLNLIENSRKKEEDRATVMRLLHRPNGKHISYV